MGNFRSNSREGGFGRGRSGSRGGFGGGRREGGFGRDRERRPAEMHDVVCDKCQKECQVPFKPSSGKPVLCSDCFRKEGGSSFGSRGSSSSGISPEQFNQLNEKLDKILGILDAVVVEEDEEDEEEEEAEGKE